MIQSVMVMERTLSAGDTAAGAAGGGDTHCGRDGVAHGRHQVRGRAVRSPKDEEGRGACARSLPDVCDVGLTRVRRPAEEMREVRAQLLNCFQRSRSPQT